MYTHPEVLQHECGDQRKMNLCLRFLCSSVSCKTWDSLSCFQFSFHNRNVRITDIILCMLWEWDLNACPHAFKINHLVTDSSPQQRLPVICIWHTLLGLSQLTVWLLHAWLLVPCRVLILYHLLSILSYSRMMQSLENMLRIPPSVCVFYKRFAASIIALSYMVGWTCEWNQICEHSLLW